MSIQSRESRVFDLFFIPFRLGLLYTAALFSGKPSFLLAVSLGIWICKDTLGSTRNFIQECLKEIPVLQRAAILFLLFSVGFDSIWAGVQAAMETGVKGGVVYITNYSLITSCSLLSLGYARTRGVPYSLMIIACAVSWMVAFNLLAGRLNFGNELLTAREQMWDSRFVQGGYRWQSPLLSSWQLSGLGRWALPMLLISARFVELGKVSRCVLLVYAGVIAYGLVKIEFRASVFPTLAAAVWYATPWGTWRNVLSAAMFLYMILAPLIFGSESFGNVLAQSIPDFIIQLSGTNIGNILTLSDRTEVWAPAIESLSRGEWLFRGQGPINLDAGIFGTFDLSFYEGLIQKYSFHQGLLDLIFIHGAMWAMIFVGSCLLVMASNWRSGARKMPNHISFLSLGMVGVSNCHDGFFSNNFVFLCVIIISLTGICRGEILPRGEAEKFLSSK